MCPMMHRVGALASLKFRIFFLGNVLQSYTSMNIRKELPKKLSEKSEGIMHIWRPEETFIIHEQTYKLKNNRFTMFIDNEERVNEMQEKAYFFTL